LLSAHPVAHGDIQAFSHSFFNAIPVNGQALPVKKMTLRRLKFADRRGVLCALVELRDEYTK